MYLYLNTQIAQNSFNLLTHILNSQKDSDMLSAVPLVPELIYYIQHTD